MEMYAKINSLKLLLILLTVLVLISCNKKAYHSFWLYSNDFGGNVYTGQVINFSSKKAILYSVLNNSIIDTFQVNNKIIYDKGDTIVEVLLENERCLIVRNGNDTIVYHSVPDLGMTKKYNQVFNFLSNNAFIYEDSHYSFQIDFDTSFHENGYRKSNLIETMYDDFSSIENEDNFKGF